MKEKKLIKILQLQSCINMLLIQAIQDGSIELKHIEDVQNAISKAINEED